jgi:hypothetical protein
LDKAFPIFRALVDAGAHLYMATQDEDTVLDIVKENFSTINDAEILRSTRRTLGNERSGSLQHPPSHFSHRPLRQHRQTLRNSLCG